MIIAEDGVLVRMGVAHLLGRFGHDVVATVDNAADLITEVETHRPDLVIADVRMPPTFTDEGLRAAVTLRGRHPGLAVLVLSQYVEQTYAMELLDSAGDGGVGYLLKDRIGDVRDFMDALAGVAAGSTVIDPDVVRMVMRRYRDPIDRLTPREREVLGLMAEGRSNAGIARALSVTDAAVGKHIGSILAKLEIRADGDDHRRVLAVLAYLRR